MGKPKAGYAAYMREYRKRNRDKLREQKKAWDATYRKLHAADINAVRRERYAENPEKGRANARRYQRENPEKIAAYRLANLAKRTLQTQAWKAVHPEHVATYAKTWREKNATRIREYSRNYYAAKRDEQIEKSRKWRSGNPEKNAAQGKTYRLKNKAKVYAKNARRRALKRGAATEHVDYDVIYRRDKGKCGICGKRVPREAMTLDHVIPLCRGGQHCPSNVQTAHRSCNSRKGARPMSEIPKPKKRKPQ